MSVKCSVAATFCTLGFAVYHQVVCLQAKCLSAMFLFLVFGIMYIVWLLSFWDACSLVFVHIFSVFLFKFLVL